jgi:outer membrane protein assembly factor BamB
LQIAKRNSEHPRVYHSTAISRIALSFVVIAIIIIAAASGFYYYSIDTHSTASTVSRSTSSSLQSSSTLSTSSSSLSTTTSLSSTSESNNQSAVSCTGTAETTYHCDYSRDGYDPNEPNLNNPSLAWTSPTLDGAVYAQPLVASGSVYVVTENDSIYSLNATTGSINWRTNVGTPVNQSGLPCGDIFPLGITGTPVIDLASRIIYFVAEVTGGHHFLFGVNIDSGSVVLNRTVDPPGMQDISAQQQRPALALNDGIVYVEFGGLDGDCSNYNGWVVGAPLNDSSKLYQFEVANFSGDYQGGIWEVGGVSIAANGDLFIASGNSASSNSSLIDYGDSVVELSPSLQVISYFTPSNAVSLNQQDLDLGTTGPILVNNSEEVFQVGKEGVGYLMNPSNLGGANGSTPLFTSQACDSAYSADAYSNSTIYVPCTSGLYALELSGPTNNPSFNSTWTADSFYSGAPIIAGGVVWDVDLDNATLLALNPATGQSMYSYQLSSPVTFETPSSADGKIFVGEGQQIVAISIST